MRTCLVIVALLVPAFADGQSTACHDAEIAFVGRAEAAVTFHVSGEAEIERARQNLKRVEEEVARERAVLDPRTDLERIIELEARRIHAIDELEMRQIRYPRPYDLTFVPLRVEQAFRGVTASTVMLLTRDLPMPVEPDGRYLIIGNRSTDLIPPFPEMADLGHLTSYVEATRVVPATSVQQEIAFLASTKSGATILGTLRKHSWGGLGSPIGGAQVTVSSNGLVAGTLTKEDGSFAVFGLPAGRLEITPALPGDLTVFNKSRMTIDVRDGACAQVNLTAEVNGRVRGRVISASGSAVKGTTIVLSSIDLTLFLADPTVHRSRSHTPQLKVAAAEDGTFEFAGVPPDTYLLIASVPQMVNGKRTTLTTFYPGASEQSAAVPVSVGHATEHNGMDFVVRME